MSWADEPMTAFDTETTGPEPTEARIVTATLITIEPGKPPIVDEWLADPGVEIPEGAAAVHGISTEHARENGRPLAEVVAEVTAALVDAWAIGPIIAFNASFDLTLIACENSRLGATFEVAGYVIDPYILDKGVDKYRKGSRKLGDVCTHYGVHLDNAHESTADALAAARVAWKIARRYPKVGNVTLDELQDLQRDWHHEQRTSFADYLIRKELPKLTDSAKRDQLVADADRIRADANGWPLRSAA